MRGRMKDSSRAERVLLFLKKNLLKIKRYRTQAVAMIRGVLERLVRKSGNLFPSGTSTL